VQEGGKGSGAEIAACRVHTSDRILRMLSVSFIALQVLKNNMIKLRNSKHVQYHQVLIMRNQVRILNEEGQKGCRH
jgi:hypothetical protein